MHTRLAGVTDLAINRRTTLLQDLPKPLKSPVEASVGKLMLRDHLQRSML